MRWGRIRSTRAADGEHVAQSGEVRLNVVFGGVSL